MGARCLPGGKCQLEIGVWVESKDGCLVQKGVCVAEVASYAIEAALALQHCGTC